MNSGSRPQLMPARAHVGDRHVEVDRPQDRGEPGQVDQVDPRVLAAAGRVDRVGQRHVARPAGFGRVPEDRGVEDDPAGQQQPEGERVQAREGHVARADHQRQEVVGQPRHHRHDEQEDHRRPVHREQLVVDLGRDQRVVRRAQLQADHQRLDAAEAEEHERRDHVHDPDPLVIGGRDPARPALLLALDAVGDYLGDGGCVGGHIDPWAESVRWVGADGLRGLRVLDLAGAGLGVEFGPRRPRRRRWLRRSACFW